jgi:hypothetical protein
MAAKNLARLPESHPIPDSWTQADTPVCLALPAPLIAHYRQPALSDYPQGLAVNYELLLLPLAELPVEQISCFEIKCKHFDSIIRSSLN